MITPIVGVKFKGDTNLVDLEQGAANTKFTLGAAFTILSDELVGIEGEFGYYPRFFERTNGSGLVARSNVTTVMGNVIVAVPRRLTRDSLRPYAVAGAGLLHVGIDDLLGILKVDSNFLGVNFGAGAIGGISRRTSLRFEVRHFRNASTEQATVGFGTTRLNFWRASVGIALNTRLF